MNNLEKTKEKLVSQFTEYILSLDEKEMSHFVYLCDNSIKEILDDSVKTFELPEGVFTCKNCEAKYGTCHEENEKRLENGEPLLCEERFSLYYRKEAAE